MARNTPPTSIATRETIRAAMRRVSQRRMKLSSGGRLARTSRWVKEKSTTGAACCASSRSEVVIGELAIPCSNVQAPLKERCCTARLCARSHERFCAGLLHRPPQALLELDLGLPAENVLGQRDVGLPDLRIVGGQRLVDDLGLRAGDLEHRLGQLEQRELVRVADVDRV